MAGYSGTPLGQKLGIKPRMRVFISGAPPTYRDLLCPLPERTSISARLGAKTDIMHLFATRRTQVLSLLKRCLACMKSDAVIWVSWPKKAARMDTDITEDVIREIALPLGLVDVKVCAVDDTWSGLKLVLRTQHRPAHAARSKYRGS